MRSQRWKFSKGPVPEVHDISALSSRVTFRAPSRLYTYVQVACNLFALQQNSGPCRGATTRPSFCDYRRCRITVRRASSPSPASIRATALHMDRGSLPVFARPSTSDGETQKPRATEVDTGFLNCTTRYFSERCCTERCYFSSAVSSAASAVSVSTTPSAAEIVRASWRERL